MAIWNLDKNRYLTNNGKLFEVVMVAGQTGPTVYTPAGNLNAATDAFGRVRFSSPYTLFDSHNLLNENNKFDETTTGSGASLYDSDGSEVSMDVTDASGDEVVRQTFRNFSYQPGKSLLIMTTFTFNEKKTNLRQRAGYFNSDNGIFVEQEDDTYYLVLRSKTSGIVSETRVAQSSWNVDKLAGEGASEITLDLSKSQIFWSDIEWLGVGSVRCGFVVNGQFILAHVFHNANINSGVYMTTPNLPVRYEITNTGATSGSSSLKQICSTVISEGGYEARAIENVVGTAALTGVTVGTSYVNLATIRLRKPGPIVVPAGADILNISNSDFEWALFKNATPSSAFSWTSATDNVEYSLETKTFSANGTRVAGGYMGGKTAPVSFGDGFDWGYQLGETIGGVSDTLTLAVRSSSSSKTAAGILKWYEL